MEERLTNREKENTLVDCFNIGTRINDNLKNECKEKMYEFCITLISAYNDERK